MFAPTSRLPERDSGFQLHQVPLSRIMSGLRDGCWTRVLVRLLLLQLQLAKVQAADPLSLKLRRLNEQFNQFKASTLARLDLLAHNQDKNSSRGLESRVQALGDHYHHMSRDLEQLNHSTAQDIDGLRDWSRKLEKKNKRMDARLALMERNLREKCRHTQTPTPDPALDFSNLTLELQSQEERLAALQAQRDELLLGLQGLQESLKNQAQRVSRLEGQLNEILQGNGKSKVRASGGPHSYHNTPQEYHELHGRGQTRRGKMRRIVDPETRAKQEGPGQIRTGPYSQVSPYHAANQPGAKPKPQPAVDRSDLKTNTDPFHPQSQVQNQLQTKLFPIQNGHLQVRKVKPQVTHSVSRSRQRSPQPEVEEMKSNTKVESAVIHNFLQIPERHKIPSQPVPKKDAAICNVDSMLLFPAASAENYVTFSRSLPDLPELSVCLWLRVEAPHVGTLLSYATDDNDNQLVLYGRSSSASSFSQSSSSSNPTYPSFSSSSSSSQSLDFVIGDPIYRRLDVVPLLDARWHHLCVLWSSIQGRFWHYSDRRLSSSGSNFRKGWEIPGGGSVVLGQEQDSVGGGFDPAEGFSGQIAGFRVWNRVLSAPEVEGLADGRGVPRGVVLGMEDIGEVHGEVQQVSCECLEHCA